MEWTDDLDADLQRFAEAEAFDWVRVKAALERLYPDIKGLTPSLCRERVSELECVRLHAVAWSIALPLEPA